jgi:hypothetical protein
MSATGADIPGGLLELTRRGKISWSLKCRGGVRTWPETFYETHLMGTTFRAELAGLYAGPPYYMKWDCPKAKQIFKSLVSEEATEIAVQKAKREHEREAAELALWHGIRRMLE